MRRAVLLLAGAAVAVGGCGGRSADVFSVDRAGSIPGATLRMVVNDGGSVRCNGSGDRTLPPELLIEAREIRDELVGPAERGLRLAPGRGSILRYDVRSADGRVRFADTSARQPPVLFRLAFFVRRTAKGVCGLPR